MDPVTIAILVATVVPAIIGEIRKLKGEQKEKFAIQYYNGEKANANNPCWDMAFALKLQEYKTRGNKTHWGQDMSDPLEAIKMAAYETHHFLVEKDWGPPMGWPSSGCAGAPQLDSKKLGSSSPSLAFLRNPVVLASAGLFFIVFLIVLLKR